MAIDFQCTGCRQWYQVPDRAAGMAVTCPKCAAEVTVPEADPFAPAAPMMLDDEEDEFAETVTEPDLPSAEFVRSAPDAAAKPVSEVQAAPQQMLFEDEATERALSLSRPALINYVMAGVIVLGVLAITVLVTIQEAVLPNPLPGSVSRQLHTSSLALDWLGERQTCHLYSVQIPRNFEPATRRPVLRGFPEGTIAQAWQATPGGNDHGSTFTVWVIPQVLDIREYLAELNNLELILGYPTEISDRSDYVRIGRDMVVVRGLVEGSSYDISRRGVIYVAAHENRTVMMLGMAVGPNSRQGQTVLDNAARTIELNTVTEARLKREAEEKAAQEAAEAALEAARSEEGSSDEDEPAADSET